MSTFNIAQIAAIVLLLAAGITCVSSGQPKVGFGVSIGFLIAWVPLAIGLFVGGR